MYTLTNPIPGVRNPFGSAGGDRGFFGGALSSDNMGNLAAGAAGYFAALPAQRIAKVVFSFVPVSAPIQEFAATTLTVLLGWLASRAIDNPTAAATFQTGVLFGAATPWFTGAAEWIKTRVPNLSGYPNPARKSAMPTLSGGRNTPRFQVPLGAGYNSAAVATGAPPSMYSSLQGDDPDKYLTPAA